MNITFHGHSCIQLSRGGHSLVIDPYLTGNPVAVTKPESIEVSHILLTHAHPDHTSDVEPIAHHNDATIVAIYELATYYGWKGLKSIGGNIGGTFDLGFARAKMIQAFHSSAMFVPEEQKMMYMGMPAGFIIKWDGITIAHMGDTALFGDMKMIGELNEIDVAIIPIGDLFTMGPDDALLAAQWLRAKTVIPVHHSTFPPIAQDAAQFVRRLEEVGIQGCVMAPGDSWVYEK